MLKYVKILQKGIIFLLLIVMSLILLVSTVNIILNVVLGAITGPETFFNAQRLQSLFGLFLIILIGIELLDTVKAFLEEEKIHVEIVLLVAMIALARKVIIWDFPNMSSGVVWRRCDASFSGRFLHPYQRNLGEICFGSLVFFEKEERRGC